MSTPNKKKDDLLTLRVIAAEAGVSVTNAYNWYRQGLLPEPSHRLRTRRFWDSEAQEELKHALLEITRVGLRRYQVELNNDKTKDN